MEAQIDFTRLVTEPLENNVFVIQCSQTGEGVLIDAAGEPERLVEIAQEHNVKRVLTTHGHWDHIGAIPQMRAIGIPVGIGAGDEERLTEFDFVIRDGDVFDVGNLRIEAIHTPGHTDGSTCFYLHDSPLLFTGDTVFPGGPGATHFPGGSKDKIITSIDGRLFQRFPDKTIVWPGHGDPTTVGTEKPHLQEWIEFGISR